MPPESFQAYSTPTLMPEYPPPPYRLGPLVGANFLCTLPDDVLPSLVPKPLAADPKMPLWLYMVHISATDPVALDYHEVGLFIPVAHADQPGVYALALFLDQSLPITIGREVWGFPKKYADSIVVDRDQARCAAQLSHAGANFLEARFHVTDRTTDLGAAQTTRVFTHRRIPSWQPNQPAIDQLVALNWHSQQETRWEGEAVELHVAFPTTSALSVLNPMRCIKVWYSQTQACTLAGGEVVQNY